MIFHSLHTQRNSYSSLQEVGGWSVDCRLDEDDFAAVDARIGSKQVAKGRVDRHG